jgi:hypothetical protein
LHPNEMCDVVCGAEQKRRDRFGLRIGLGGSSNEALGWTLLIVSAFVGSIVLYWGSSGDEADNLVVGSLLIRGYVLYRDIFSHHLPFTYYWAAAVMGLLGESILVARLSVLLFQVTSFAIAMKLSHFYLSLALASLFWNIIGYLYRGNMLLYNMLCASSVAVVFSVTLCIVGREVNATWKHVLTIGVFSAVAVLSDPLSLYAIVIAFVFLCVSSAGLRRGVLAGSITTAALACYG